MRLGGRSVTYGRIPRGPYRVAKTTLGGNDSVVSKEALATTANHPRPNQADKALTKDPTSLARKIIRGRSIKDTLHVLDTSSEVEKLVRFAGSVFWLGTKKLGEPSWLGSVNLDKVPMADIAGVSIIKSYFPIQTALALDFPFEKHKYFRFVSTPSLLSDIAEHGGAMQRILFDIDHTTDSPERFVVAVRVFSDESILQDIATKATGSIHVVGDSLYTIGSVSFNGGGKNFISDLAPNADLATRLRIFPRTLSDEIDMTEMFEQHLIYVRPTAETLLTADTPVRKVFLPRTVSDLSIESDHTSRGLILPRFNSDVAYMLDSTFREGAKRVRAVTDKSVVLDIAGRIKNNYAYPSDLIRASDLARISQRVDIKNLVDHLYATDLTKFIVSYIWEHGKYDYVILPYNVKTSNLTFIVPLTKEPFRVENNLLDIPRLELISAVKKAQVEEEDS